MPNGPARTWLRPVLLLAACSASACGMPRANEPAQVVAAEAEVELMGAPQGGPADESHASEPSPVLAEARRPGWGTMAPIPNPGDETLRTRAAGQAPAYRLIGPTAPVRRASTTRLAPPLRAELETGPAAGIMVERSPRPASGVRRIRHWIVPVAQRN